MKGREKSIHYPVFLWSRRKQQTHQSHSFLGCDKARDEPQIGFPLSLVISLTFLIGTLEKSFNF